MKLAVVLGTRPEIIKLAPVIRECERQKLDFFILHTGQHYSYNMDAIFFEQLELPKPRYNLKVGSGTYAEEVARMLVGMEWILLENKPDIVLVEGDTNTCVAGALMASKCKIDIGHIEAGLRSYFSGMPEEINRVLVDHISKYLFVPTDVDKINLVGEGISYDRIFVTGNTIVDALSQSGISRGTSSKERYILVTVHRYDNVRNISRFRSILEGLKLVSKEFNLPILYPMHPGARRMLEEYGLKADFIKVMEPIDYYSFLKLEANATLIITDSGGVQEEACVFGVPCVTLRDNTERPESVEVGANILAGADPERILECAKIMMGKSGGWLNPFGDGKAAIKILDIIRREYG